MQPFLEIPICLANSEKEEKDTVSRIRPNDISYYYPGFNWGTVIVMKCGSAVLTRLTFDEVDAALTGFHEYVKKNPNKFGNLCITPKKKSNILHPVN